MTRKRRKAAREQEEEATMAKVVTMQVPVVTTQAMTAKVTLN